MFAAASGWHKTKSIDRGRIMKINWQTLLSPHLGPLHTRTINQRLITLFVLLVGGFILVGVIYWAMITLDSRSDKINDAISEFGFGVDRIQIGVLQARREEKNFFARPDDSYLQKHGKALTNVYADINTAAATAPDAESRVLLEQIRTQVKIYQGVFRGAVEAQRRAGYDQKSGLN